MSSGDPRERHRGLSHHSRTVLELLLIPVGLPAPAGHGHELAAAAQREARVGGPHRVSEYAVDLAGYAASGLPASTMGRGIEGDEMFFAAALAAGAALAEAI